MMHGLSFEDPSVKARSLRLKAAEGKLGKTLSGDPRDTFIVGVVTLAQRIAMSAEAAKHQRRQVGPPYGPVTVVLDPRHFGSPPSDA
jgi:hypothetical protein